MWIPMESTDGQVAGTNKNTRQATKPGGRKRGSDDHDWHRLPHLRWRCGVSVSGVIGLDPSDHFSIAHGVDSFNVKVADEAENGREVPVLLQQTFPDGSPGSGDDQVDSVRVKLFRIRKVDADQV